MLCMVTGFTAVCLAVALSCKSSTVGLVCLALGSSSTLRPQVSFCPSGLVTYRLNDGLVAFVKEPCAVRKCNTCVLLRDLV